MVHTSNVVNAEMNSTWKQFLQQRVNSFIKWDLVRFFHDNPHTADTAENIAHYIGREARVVQRELDGLVSTNVLEQTIIAGQRIYRLSENDETRSLVREFVAACHDREFRIKAINHVIRGMGATPRHNF